VGPWTAQCVPEQGDWYARKMYIQGERDYDYHVKTYGHPSKVGFMEIDHLWKAEKWDPARLIALYKRAGAKYFFGLANHHDNLDMYNSAHHAWNSVNVGPKEDIIGTWAKVVRESGLAVWGDQPRVVGGAMAATGLRLRRRRPARRRPVRRVHAEQSGWQGQMVGGPRSAGTIHGQQRENAGWDSRRGGG